jgi:hypothetical protein
MERGERREDRAKKERAQHHKRESSRKRERGERAKTKNLFLAYYFSADVDKVQCPGIIWDYVFSFIPGLPYSV